MITILSRAACMGGPCLCRPWHPIWFAITVSLFSFLYSFFNHSSSLPPWQISFHLIKWLPWQLGLKHRVEWKTHEQVSKSPSFFLLCVCVGGCMCVTERQRDKEMEREGKRDNNLPFIPSFLHPFFPHGKKREAKTKNKKRDPSRFASVFVKWREKHIIKLHGLAVCSQAQTTPVMHKSIARKANWATFNKHKTGRGYLIINSWSKKKKSRMRTDVKPHLKDMHTKNTHTHTQKKIHRHPFTFSWRRRCSFGVWISSEKTDFMLHHVEDGFPEA